MTHARAVRVVGIGDDGCRSLSSRAFDAIAAAQVLVGGTRQLAFFPEFRGQKLTIAGRLDAVLKEVEKLADENTVCVLASGDPLFFGIGARLIEQLGAEHVEVIPAPSAVQLAFARAGVAWDDARVISVHGRPLAGVVAQLRATRKAALFTDGENNPRRIAEQLLEYNERGLTAYVCEHLGGPDERVRRFSLPELAETTDIAKLNVLILVGDASPRKPIIPYLPETEFAKRVPKLGLITKREVRMLSLAALGLTETSVVWDVGAGSGSVGIEAALIARRGRVYAIETDEECVGMIADNARTHGADNLTVVAGLAPDALLELEAPDAVFIGGSKGSMQAIMELAFSRLSPGGRLVVNAITLENMHEAYAAARGMGVTPEVSMVQVSRAEPLARYMRLAAQNPIQILSVQKPEASP
jgi:precorrin-6B C5,15-methyltransferase / cobalt-precorrin-6B C5,C15-methyltransferase